MKRNGRANLLLILAAVGIVAILGLLLFSKGTPSQAASEFLVALAKGDVKKLTDLSFMDGDTPEEIEKKWTYTTQVVGPHYRFVWKMVGESVVDPQTASVRLQFVRNALSPSAYEENFALPMVNKDGKWKVDVRAISREMYPGLPR